MVLPTHPSPSPSQDIPISQPPPTNTTVIEPVTKTSKVSETQLHQPQTPPSL